MADTYQAPGRLGNPNMDLEHDPRVHPLVLAALQSLGLSGHLPSDDQPPTASLTELAAQMASSHTAFTGVYDGLPNELPADAHEPEVTHQQLSIPGAAAADQPLALHLFRRADIPATTPLPAILYVHGGGMAILDVLNKVHVRWCRSLAQAGVAVILVGFRNSWTPAAHNPFPAGLHDCAAAARYVAAHRRELGVGKLVLQGESGGGNLVLATALLARREGWAHELGGVHATIPFISGGYAWPAARKRAELPSLAECDGYFVGSSMMAAMVVYYTPEAADRENPLAWPYHATAEDLKGLPPHMLSMDELDPLRDEGVAYARKLAAAGVEVTAEVNLGGVHGTSLIFRQPRPEVYRKAVSQIAAFALSL